jgi:pyruvate/2-oxoglutarate dehydrogenase complex dihydrolipoamide dehydrogenase (E3) component
MQNFDHIILGTGQATGTLLNKLIASGDSIAVIEGGKVGGSCVNYGCTPTKTLVASAKAIHKAQRGEDYGFTTGPIQADYSAIRARMNKIRNQSSDGLKEWIESSDNVTFIQGWASFEDRKILKVNDQLLKGEHIYINSGTRPVEPPIVGLEEVPWMDSAGLLNLETLPEHLLIIGGGYIGMEFAQIYKRLGSEVTVLQRQERIMPREDKDISEAVRSFLEAEGIKILCGAQVTAVHLEEGDILLKYKQNGSMQSLSGSHLLIAAGRRPNSDHLNLAKAGIHIDDRGYIQVDEYCRTSAHDVFALGDVNGRGAFTHTSVNDAEIVLDYLYNGSRKISDRIPIYALFTDPPLGRVGMTETEALSKGRKIMTARRPMSKISRAKEMGETNGFAKLIVDADTDHIIGAAILGPGGDEIINMFAAIMHSQIPCREYRKVVLVHPTVSELMPWVLDGLELVDAK